eukprot:TRINITY_DN17172_c1_g3_i1.p1 TRINITY_DN17172_c1_g3~~TRINITY_DN17172_c1_g3_i1.p1  ORF type:complete len:498 (+),score=67.26 TRINITY_DN17172_c1_g3_i1:416-1909(+)
MRSLVAQTMLVGRMSGTWRLSRLQFVPARPAGMRRSSLLVPVRAQSSMAAAPAIGGVVRSIEDIRRGEADPLRVPVPDTLHSGLASAAPLEIPPTPPWQVPPIPTSPEELLHLVTSTRLWEALSSRTGASMVAYGTLRTLFFAAQGVATMRAINYKTNDGPLKDGISNLPTVVRGYVTGGYLAAIVELLRRDEENIRRGYYRPPHDMHPRHRQWSPAFIRANASKFVEFSRDVLARRERDGRLEAAQSAEEAVREKPDLYPEYYLQNFHFQDGWLSELTAQSYEVATETLFLGTQDAMQRGALVPLHFFMKQRSKGMERRIRLLDMACGTGRFLTFVKDNYPQMQTYGVELSPFFLKQAQENMDYWMKFDRKVNGDRAVNATTFLHARAEAVPLDAGSLDVVTCNYLFHELLPEARGEVVAEMARLLRPAGIVIFIDSLQRVDRPGHNFTMFPANYHEPYFLSYVDTDLPALFGASGFRLVSSAVLHVSKVMCFEKL